MNETDTGDATATEGDNNVGDNDVPAEFQFDKWAADAGLTRATEKVLRVEELTTKQALILVEPGDLIGLGLTLGQRKLLQDAIRRLTEVSGDAHSQPSLDTQGVYAQSHGLPHSDGSSKQSLSTDRNALDLDTVSQPVINTELDNGADNKETSNSFSGMQQVIQ